MVRFVISVLISISCFRLISCEEFHLISTRHPFVSFRRQAVTENPGFYLLKKIVKDHHIVVDVGAGNSDWSNKVFSINNSICLYLIEGNPDLFFQIQISNSENINRFLVKICNCNHESELQEITSVDSVYSPTPSTEICSPILNLTEFCEEEYLFHIDLLHINKINFSHEILLGAFPLIKKGEIASILMHYSLKSPKDNLDFEKITSYLMDQNYELFCILPNGLEKISHINKKFLRHKLFDVLAIHNSRVSMKGSKVTFRLTEY